MMRGEIFGEILVSKKDEYFHQNAQAVITMIQMTSLNNRNNIKTINCILSPMIVEKNIFLAKNDSTLTNITFYIFYNLLYIWNTILRVGVFTDLHGWSNIYTHLDSSVISTLWSHYRSTVGKVADFLDRERIWKLIFLWDMWNSSDSIEIHSEVHKYFDEKLWRFWLEKLLGNHCEWSTNGLDDTIARDKYNIWMSPRVIELWEMQWLICDNIEWSGKRTKVPYEALDQLSTTVDNLVTDTAVFMHYSITEDPKNAYYWYDTASDKMFLQNSWVIREIFEWSKRVRRVLNGHAHRHFETEIWGITYTTIPSISQNIGGTIDGMVWVLDTSVNELVLAKAA